MLLAVMTMLVLVSADTTSQESGPQARIIGAWKTIHSEFAPCYDAINSQWIFSIDVNGETSMFRAADFGSAPEPLAVTASSHSYGLGYLTVSANGEAYAVTYIMGKRQTYTTIVRVTTEKKQITVGETIASAYAEAFTTSPTISPDGSTIILVSDRPGGVGGTDLWYIEKQPDGSWGTPQHCGEALNSPHDEVTPHFVSSDTLLFSSNGFGGLGGMDVFQSVFKDGKWQDPIPLDAVNTSNDETDAIITPEGECMFARNDVTKPKAFHLYRVALTSQYR